MLLPTHREKAVTAGTDTATMISVLTAGGPGNSTSVMAYYIYKTAFTDFKMGYACALAWVLFLLIFAVTLVQWKFQDRFANE